MTKALSIFSNLERGHNKMRSYAITNQYKHFISPFPTRILYYWATWENDELNFAIVVDFVYSMETDQWSKCRSHLVSAF